MADRRLEVKSNRHGAFDLLTTTAKLGVHLCVEGAKPPGVLLDYLLQGSGANQHASTWLVHCTTTCAVSKHVTSHIKINMLCAQRACSKWYIHQIIKFFAQMVHLINTHGCCK